MHILSCPPAADLVRLRRGEVPAPASEPLLQHLGGCATCTATAATLAHDSLQLDLHRAAAPPSPHEPALTALVERLGGLGPTLTFGYDPAAFDPVLEAAQGADELGRLGGYRILSVLGRGGMGVVYRAEDTQLRRPVALKVIRPELAGNAASRARFFREARSAAALEHEHVVPVYHVGEAAGTVFLAMPLLAGETLDERLRCGPLPVADALRVAREAALGLVAAHAAGLIHRDLKPANLFLLQTTGRAVLLDFGLARPLASDGFSEPGLLVGTPGYLAPEQACGRPVDARADLFSLGCTLYHALTGTPPFDGPDVLSKLHALANRTVLRAHTVNPAVPRELSELTARLLERDPARRPTSAQAVVNELAQLKLAPCRRKQRMLLALIGGMVAAAVTLATVIVIYDKKGQVVAKLEVPDGGKVEIMPSKPPTANMIPPVEPQQLPPQQLPPTGVPMTPWQPGTPPTWQPPLRPGAPATLPAPTRESEVLRLPPTPVPDKPRVAIPPGLRAYTLRVPASALNLLPGTKVDVLGVRMVQGKEPPAGNGPPGLPGGPGGTPGGRPVLDIGLRKDLATLAGVLLRDCLVLGVEHTIPTAPGMISGAGDAAAEKACHLTLALKPDDVLTLARASELWPVAVCARRPGDKLLFLMAGLQVQTGWQERPHTLFAVELDARDQPQARVVQRQLTVESFSERSAALVLPEAQALELYRASIADTKWRLELLPLTKDADLLAVPVQLRDREPLVWANSRVDVIGIPHQAHKDRPKMLLQDVSVLRVWADRAVLALTEEQTKSALAAQDEFGFRLALREPTPKKAAE
jgi:hypothetical protein